MNMIRQYSGLPKEIYFICFARIILSMGAFMFSMNSLLMTYVLGLSEVTTGYIMLMLSVFDIFGALLGGKLSDKYGRKKILIIAMTAEIIALLIGGAYVRSLVVIACEAVVMTCFSMFFPVFGALITDKTGEGKREESFSLLFLCINIGYAAGQVIAGAIFYNYTEWIFWGQGIATVIMLMVIIFFIHDDYDPLAANMAENGERRSKETFDSASDNAGLIRKVLRDKPLVLFLIATIFTGYAYMQVSYMMPLQFAGYFGAKISSKWVARLWSVNAIFCVIWSPVILKLSKNKNEFLVIMWAAILFMLGMGSFAFIKDISLVWLVYLLTPIWTAGEVILSVHNSVLLGSRADAGYRARYQSLYEFTNGGGRMIGPVTMGYFLITHSYNQGWVLVAILCVIAAVILYSAFRMDERKKI
ncbi:MAG: MFS transporter [Firmicutes bacterium]|nr:MFS transporter [Bacillota bacterium]